MTLGVLLKARRVGCVDLAIRFGADMLFEPGYEWPLADHSVQHIFLGDATATRSLQDQVMILRECRRVLVPGGTALLTEPQAAQSFAVMASTAELFGLVSIEPNAEFPGWKSASFAPVISPLVSILIPSSNPKYFIECLDSAIAQTYRPIEIIICDDCESDAISQLVRSRAHCADITYIKNPQRLRARKNFEKCLSLARGTYVKFLNDDDVLEPTCVATFVDAFQRVPGLVLATSHRWRIDADSYVIDDMPATQPVVAEDLIIDGVTLANAAIMHGLNFIGEPSTALFRRSDFDPRPHVEGISGSDETSASPFHFNGEPVRGAIDLAMWARLLVQGNAAFFQARLSRFRIHAEQAQARSDVVERSVVGIRGLQQRWIALGLFRRVPPSLFRCKPLLAEGANPDNLDWRFAPLLSLADPVTSPPRALKAWRDVRRHPFETP